MRSGSRRLVRVSPDDPGIARIRRGRGFAYRDPRGRAGVTRDLRGDGLSRARLLAGAFRLIDEAPWASAASAMRASAARSGS
ncbi:MAG TPA: hypothetical protein VKZ73_05380, partial [Microbacterium sp.]|nr:hypothetical protein [Microbacterium sp.]